jgi:dipeptidyl aminopeptidase/acylaminoacyl peptidase
MRRAGLAVFLSLILAVGLGVRAQTRAPLTHETLWSFKRVGAPVASPDGRWVVFPVSEVGYDPAQDVSDLWIVPGDGSAAPRRLTSNKAGESGPAFSPDGTKLAFAARRDGDEAAQVYVLDLAAGGDAQRVTNAPTSASTPKWSPDGTSIAYQAAMWAGATDEETNRRAAADRRAIKSKVRIYDTFPIRNFDVWNDDSSPQVWTVDPSGNRKSHSVFGATKLAAGRGFALTGGFAWTPDSSSIVFAATERNDASAREYVTSHLYSVSARSGEATRLTDDTVDAAAPDFSPDGRTLCFAGSGTQPSIYHVARLACTAWSPAASRPGLTYVSQSLDRSVGTWDFSADSTTLFFTAEDSGRERVYRVPVAGGAVKPLVDAPDGVFTNVTAPARAGTLFANWGSAVSPAEVVRIDPATGARTFLSTFNKATAAAIDWAPLREFTFVSKSGRTLHSWLAVPPNFDPARKYPLFVLIHGGHANMWRDEITYRWNYHLLSQPNVVMLMTDYRGSTGYGEKFTLDIQGDPLAGPAEDVNDAADEAIKRFSFIDGARQCAGGASYGGHLTNWLEGTTTRYKCLISHAGLATLDMQWGTSDGIYHRELMMGGPFWSDPAVWNAQNPLAKAGNFKTPMLLSVGELDYRVPHGNTLTMYAALQRMNVPARLLVWPDENHWILKGENSRVFYREVRAWLDKYLK